MVVLGGDALFLLREKPQYHGQNGANRWELNCPCDDITRLVSGVGFRVDDLAALLVLNLIF